MNAASRQNNAPHSGLSILIADDDQDTVMTLAALLTDDGHVTHTVTHGALVMEAVIRFKPQVCILDIEMPGHNGYQLARDIAAKFGHGRPTLVAISGKWKSQTDQLLAKAVGFDHFLTKPADPVELERILESLTPPASAA